MYQLLIYSLFWVFTDLSGNRINTGSCKKYNMKVEYINLSSVSADKFTENALFNSSRVAGFTEALLSNVATDLEIKVEMAVKYKDLSADSSVVEDLMEIVTEIRSRLQWLNQLHVLKYELTTDSFRQIRYMSTLDELVAMKKPENS
jgi:hypothetical protein